MEEKKSRKISPLAEAEMEVLAEGQEWMRRRLKKKLQRLAETEGKIPPPEPTTNSALPSDPNPTENLRGSNSD